MRRPVQELFGDYQNNLYAAAFNVCKNAEDAKDVVQDTFIQYYSLKADGMRGRNGVCDGCWRDSEDNSVLA